MKRITTLFFSLLALASYGQQRAPYSQYYLNPTLINPAYVTESGYTNLFVNHRIQWMGIDDGPVTTTAVLQMPVNERLSVGAQFIKDHHSTALQTYEANFLTGYNVFLDRTGSRYLSFGFGLGMGQNVIDYDGYDQAIMEAQDKSFYVAGQFGVSIHLQKLKLGFSMPELIDSDILNKDDFEDLGLEATQKMIGSVSYRMSVGSQFELEPTAVYRSDKEGKAQWEGLGMLYYKDVAWVGAGYRQDYGAVAHLGMTINRMFKFAYSYEFAPEVTTGIGNGSHEFQLVMRLGKKDKRKKAVPIISDNSSTESNLPVAEDIQEKRFVTTTVKPQAITSAPEKSEVTKISSGEVISPTPSAQLEERTRDAWEITTDEEIASSLKPGYYLVVGAFKKGDNAKRYNQEIQRRGYTSDIAFDTVSEFNYVYLNRTSGPESLQAQRDIIRNTNILYFPEAWILHIR